MAAYVVQWLGAVMLIMIVMSLLVFLATHALLSNAAALILGQYSTPETEAATRTQTGLRPAAAGAILALGEGNARR
jgi:ABC-type dipeptide/oligopeptide/nickel transport system permease component